MAIPKHRGKIIQNSPRLQEFKKKKQQESKKRLLLAVLFLLVFSTGLIFISRWSRVNILDIQISGNKVIDTESIQKSVSAQTSGYYLWLVPRSNFLFYPKNSIISTLESDFKRLKNVSMDIKDNTLVVSVAEREALYTWCGVERSIAKGEDEKCYFLDDSGYIFDEAPFFSGGVYFRFYGSLSDNEGNVLGSYYFRDIFTKLVSFEKFVEEIDLKPVAMQVEPAQEIKLFLSSDGSSVQPEIRLKTDLDFEKIAENLETAVDTDPLKTKLAKNYSALSYIDLRFGNKVYFKFNE